MTAGNAGTYCSSIGAGQVVGFVDIRFFLMTISRPGNIGAASWAVLAVLAGCAAPPRDPEDSAKRDMLALLMPSRVEIVRPFTGVRSFGGGSAPDGIELLLRAVNPLDNPGLMIAGNIRVELYQYVPASGESKGPLVEHWNVDLTTEKQQRAYWNRMTQMYEFRLAYDAAGRPADDAYVLCVTYSSPLGDRLTDELVLSRKTGPETGLGRRP